MKEKSQTCLDQDQEYPKQWEPSIPFDTCDPL